MIAGWNGGPPTVKPIMKVSSAYNIDAKIDDGLPQSGNVIAKVQIYTTFTWVGANYCSWGLTTPTTGATPYATTNCYDNNNVVGTQKYSMQNADTGNCAISLRM